MIPRSLSSAARRRPASIVVLAVLALASGCSSNGSLRDQISARKEIGALRAAFLQETEASTRAVLSDQDDSSVAAVNDARAAAARVVAANAGLRARLQTLGYAKEAALLGEFETAYQEYAALETDVLRLAVENSNTKARRLSVADGQRAADALFAALDRVPGLGADDAAVRAAVVELQLIELRHIMEPDDAAMAAMESRMDQLAARARAPLTARGSAAADSAQALDAFLAVHAEVMALSRRNTDLKGLALTLGRKRVVAAACADTLAALDEALAGHGTEATR